MTLKTAARSSIVTGEMATEWPVRYEAQGSYILSNAVDGEQESYQEPGRTGSTKPLYRVGRRLCLVGFTAGCPLGLLQLCLFRSLQDAL